MLATISVLTLITIGAVDKANPKVIYNWIALGSLVTLFGGLL